MGKDKQKYKECYSVASVYFDNTSDIHGRTTVFTTLKKALQYMEDIIPAYIDGRIFGWKNDWWIYRAWQIGWEDSPDF